MEGISFGLDYKALLLALGSTLLLFFAWQLRSHVRPTLFFSNLADLVQRPTWRVRLSSLPRYLFLAAMTSLLLAFIDPHFYVSRQLSPSTLPTEGVALYLLTDQSGSMRDPVAFTEQNKMPKIEYLKEITTEFVQGRPQDMIGLIAFARVPHVLVPLTLDHNALLQKLAQIQVVSNPEEDGTAIGYALYKAANIIAATRYYGQGNNSKERPAYDMKGASIILITDGFDDPSYLDKGNRLRNIDPVEAAQYAKEQGIRIYIINVDPALASEKFGPQRRQMQRTAELTGGQFYSMDSSNDLRQIFHEIDQKEKIAQGYAQGPVSTLPKAQQPQFYQRISLYPYLIALGMLLLLLSVFLATTVLRRVP